MLRVYWDKLKGSLLQSLTSLQAFATVLFRFLHLNPFPFDSEAIRQLFCRDCWQGSLKKACQRAIAVCVLLEASIRRSRPLRLHLWS